MTRPPGRTTVPVHDRPLEPRRLLRTARCRLAAPRRSGRGVRTLGIWQRLRLLFAAKTSSALDRAEDPREVLDYAYAQQQQLLLKLKQSLVEVATSKEQLGQQARKLSGRIPQLDGQARRAVSAGRDDLARMALERKHTAIGELDGLKIQLAEVDGEERRLAAQGQQLAARIEQFPAQRAVFAARYT